MLLSDKRRSTEDTGAMPPTLPIPKPVLVELFAHASSAARIIGHLDDRGGTHVERLADHIDALAHKLGGLLGTHYLTVEPLPADDETAQPATAVSPIDEFRQLMMSHVALRLWICRRRRSAGARRSRESTQQPRSEPPSARAGSP